MAQIVCIDTGTVRPNCEIDDIVAIHDDDVELAGKGYDTFSIVKVEGKTGKELNELFALKRPEIQEADDKTYWLNPDGKWCELVNNPKYAFSFSDVTGIDKIALASKETLISIKEAILDKTLEKIHLDEENNVEVAELNK